MDSSPAPRLAAPGREQRPNFHPGPPMSKPTGICRMFLYRGFCNTTECRRAHISPGHMVELLKYLRDRGCPPEYLSHIKSNLSSPDWNRCRRRQITDDICFNFLNKTCRSNPQNPCLRFHPFPDTVYADLVHYDKTNRPQQLAAHPVGPEPRNPLPPPPMLPPSDAVQMRPDDPSPLPHIPAPALPPTIVDDSRVVVRLPETVRLGSSPLRDPAGFDVVVRVPHARWDAADLGGRDPPPHVQRPFANPSITTVTPPPWFEEIYRTGGLSPSPAPEQNMVCNVNLQSARIPESLSLDSSFSAESASGESTVSDSSEPSTPQTVSPPKEPPKLLIPSNYCRDWILLRRCFRGVRCKFIHASPQAADDIVSSLGLAKRPLPGLPSGQMGVAGRPTPLPKPNGVPVPPVNTPRHMQAQQQALDLRPPPAPCAPVAQPLPPPHPIARDPAILAVCSQNGNSRAAPHLPHAPQPMPAQVAPSARRDTLPTQPPQPPKPRDLPPPRQTDEVTFTVADSTRATFSGGFEVVKIVTGFESLWVAIENLPPGTEKAAVERLAAPFGTVEEVRVPDENSTKPLVSVRMGTYPEVVSVIDALDESEVFGRRIRVRLSMGKTHTNRLIRDGDVRVSWQAPVKKGYAGYETLKAAQKAVSAADGQMIRKHWITASIYEGMPVIGAYNVQFNGLPSDAPPKYLKRFGPAEDIMLERPTYHAQEFGALAVQRVLGDFGKMVYFEPNPPPYKDGIVRAWCRFESPDVANAVCELHKVKQRVLGMERLYVQRVLSVLEHMPRDLFVLVEPDLHRLRQNVCTHTYGAHLDILASPNADQAAVRLVAEDPQTLARLRTELSEIVRGEVLKEDGVQAWDDFLRGEAGSHFLDDLRAQNPAVMVNVDRLRRCVRLIGAAERREPVATAILAKLASLRTHKLQTVPLAGRLIGLIMSADLMALQRRHGPENVWIDLPRQTLCVRGPEALFEEAQRVVHGLKMRHPAERGAQDCCPVCFEPPLTPVALHCGHTWCKACLTSYLRASADGRAFPVGCLGNEGRCTALVPAPTAVRVLSPADFDALARAAFHAHVQARPDEFNYCPTADCPQVYRAGPRDAVLSCPSCLARICAFCRVEYHEGVACADRADGGDRLFEEWTRTHGVKRCPGCRAPIERAEGCNHMTCTRCRTHTCWVCLETFPQGKGIYDHMREFHGGIGL
ncbi:hypothetical protein BC834DRAFT_252997 [Gloeopeniophorella convolvens]|nr:hypothetical protein BC834DRAFT_252997 [Gloeopeniophorella convolvens]